MPELSVTLASGGLTNKATAHMLFFSKQKQV